MLNAPSSVRTVWGRGETVVLAAGFLLHMICCNGVLFGHYVDDIKWVLLAEEFLKGSAQASWSFIPRVETSLNWGWSLMLAPVIALVGRHILLIKIFSALLFWGGLFLFYGATRSLVKENLRPVYAFFLFINGYVLSYCGNVISESGYIFLFGLLIHGLFHPRWKRGAFSVPLVLFWGGLTSLLLLTRTVGMIAVPLVGAALWKQKSPRAALLFGLSVGMFSLPFFLFSHKTSGSFSFYQSFWGLRLDHGFMVLAQGSLKNLFYYLKGFTGLTFFFLPTVFPPLPWIKFLSTGLLTFTAWRGVQVSTPSPLTTFLKGYGILFLGVLAFWSYQEPRYGMPLLPLFVCFFVVGLGTLTPSRWGRFLPWGLISISLFTNASEIRKIVQSSLSQPVTRVFAYDTWIEAHTKPSDLLLSMDAAPLYFHTGRRGTPFLPAPTVESFAFQAAVLGIKFFVLPPAGLVPPAPGVDDPIQAQYDRLTRYLKDARFFQPVYEDPRESVTIYTLRPETIPPLFDANTATPR